MLLCTFICTLFIYPIQACFVDSNNQSQVCSIYFIIDNVVELYNLFILYLYNICYFSMSSYEYCSKCAAKKHQFLHSFHFIAFYYLKLSEM